MVETQPRRLPRTISAKPPLLRPVIVTLLRVASTLRTAWEVPAPRRTFTAVVVARTLPALTAGLLTTGAAAWRRYWAET